MLLLRTMGWNDTMRLIACRAEPSQTAELSRVTAAEIFVAGSALLMLITAQWILSSTITGTNYLGLDGKGVQSVVLAAFKFAGYFDVTNLHPIQGVGSQLLPKNVWANPSLWPFALFAKAPSLRLREQRVIIKFLSFFEGSKIRQGCAFPSSPLGVKRDGAK